VAAQSHATLEEYFKLDEATPGNRYEYFDGLIRTRPNEIGYHYIAAVNVMALLGNALKDDASCFVFPPDIWVQIGPACVVHLDVTVTYEPIDYAGTSIHAPVLAIEVLSPNTEAFDRGRKAQYYRACPSMMEYVLVAQDRVSVEVQRRHKESNLWTIENYSEGETFTLNSIGVTLAVADIYRKVVFPETTQPEP
jgi:Uma2 family endonuclease